MPLQESDFLKTANDEYVGRLQARNRIILNFIGVAAALIGIAAAEKTAGFAFVFIGVGFFSLAATLLSRHHELMMGHLIAYQRKLTKIFQPTLTCEGWHDFRQEQIDDARKHRDTAVFVIHAIFCASAWFVAGARESYKAEEGWFHNVKVALFVLSLACGIVSFFLIRYTQKERNRLSQLTVADMLTHDETDSILKGVRNDTVDGNEPPVMQEPQSETSRRPEESMHD